MPAREVAMSVALESDDRDSDSDSDRDSSSDSDSSNDTDSSGDSGPSGDSDSTSDSESSSDSCSDSGSSSDSSLGSPRSKQRVAGSSSSEDDDGDDDCDSESDEMSDSGAKDNPRAERSAAARTQGSQAGVEVNTDREDDENHGTSSDKSAPCMCTQKIPAEWESPRFPVMCSKLPPLPDMGEYWRGLLQYGNGREERRLARIGDAVLEELLVEILRKRFDLPVGPRALTMALVQNSVLSVLALHYGFSRYADATQHHWADRFEAAVATLYDNPYKRALLPNWLEGVFSLAVFPDIALQIKRFRATLTSQRIAMLRLKHDMKAWGLTKLSEGRNPLFYTEPQL